jgi:hypothetical protein
MAVQIVSPVSGVKARLMVSNIPSSMRSVLPAMANFDACGYPNSVPWQQVGSVMSADSQPAVEAALKCRSCKEGRYPPPVRMINLTATQESGCIRLRSGNVATLRFSIIVQTRWDPG